MCLSEYFNPLILPIEPVIIFKQYNKENSEGFIIITLDIFSDFTALAFTQVPFTEYLYLYLISLQHLYIAISHNWLKTFSLQNINKNRKLREESLPHPKSLH